MDLVKVKGMWEMAVVFHFLHVFRGPLEVIADGVRMETLEQAIVRSTGQGLLTRLHIGLMKGLKPKLNVDETNWPAVLSRKFRSECLDADENPFTPERGNEAEHYCNASVVDRVLILKMLCELRCCEGDVREIFELCLKPNSKNRRPPKKKHKKEVSELSQFRPSPIGQLNATTLFWFLDCPDFVDFRLYKETREHLKRGGTVHGHTRIKSWELIAADVEKLQQFGEELPSAGSYCRSLKKKVLELVPRLEKRIEREERKIRATERLKRHECNIILDLNGGYGRSARQRTEAKYTFEEYERAMAEAIDEGIMTSEENDSDAMSISEEESPNDLETFQQSLTAPNPFSGTP